MPWKQTSVLLLNSERPSYWWLNPEDEWGEGPDRGRWDRLRAYQKTASDGGSSFNYMPPPNDTIERGFKELLADCDADFLLRGLSGDDRVALDRLTDQWTDTIAKFIVPLYDVDDRKGKRRVLSAIDSDLRRQSARRRADLKGWVNDAVYVFSRNDRRVTRRAIEVAQRCVLAGLDPVAIVVESEPSLLRRWNRFLRLTVRGQIIPRSGAGEGAGQIEGAGNDTISEGSEIEVQDTKDSILRLAGKPGDVELARGIIPELRDIPIEIWRGVFEALDGEPEGVRISSAVKHILEIVLRGNPESVLSAEELFELCEPIWKAASSAGL